MASPSPALPADVVGRIYSLLPSTRDRICFVGVCGHWRREIFANVDSFVAASDDRLRCDLVSHLLRRFRALSCVELAADSVDRLTDGILDAVLRHAPLLTRLVLHWPERPNPSQRHGSRLWTEPASTALSVIITDSSSIIGDRSSSGGGGGGSSSSISLCRYRDSETSVGMAALATGRVLYTILDTASRLEELELVPSQRLSSVYDSQLPFPSSLSSLSSLRRLRLQPRLFSCHPADPLTSLTNLSSLAFPVDSPAGSPSSSHLPPLPALTELHLTVFSSPSLLRRGQDAATLAAGLGRLSGLSRLSLTYSIGSYQAVFPGMFPRSLGPSSSRLVCLSLSGLRETPILPESLGSLPALRALAVHDCPELERFPSTVSRLSSLTGLSIVRLPRLSVLPPLLSFTRLSSLTVDSCPLCPQSLLSGLCHSGGTLSRLHLSSACATPCVIPCLPSVTEIRTDAPCLPWEPPPPVAATGALECTWVTEVTRKFPALTSLHWSNRLRRPSPSQRAVVLAAFAHRGLASLALSGAGIDSLPVSAAEATSLVHLELAGSSITVFPADLISSLPGLRRLRLVRCERLLGFERPPSEGASRGEECREGFPLLDLCIDGCCSLKVLPDWCSSVKRLELVNIPHLVGRE